MPFHASGISNVFCCCPAAVCSSPSRVWGRLAVASAFVCLLRGCVSGCCCGGGGEVELLACCEFWVGLEELLLCGCCWLMVGERFKVEVEEL